MEPILRCKISQTLGTCNFRAGLEYFRNHPAFATSCPGCGSSIDIIVFAETPGGYHIAVETMAVFDEHGKVTNLTLAENRAAAKAAAWEE